ncbi:MAG: type II toxin-antitoxin system RelE/ParE family toxin [Campylobacterales bacterium]|nr:type II toxin-antitoxin system RelE/ParE family toxin [Campylobacterales bacterium]
MKITNSPLFEKELNTIISFISDDSINRALDFTNSLESEINILPEMPFKFRPSYYYDDKNIRDMIFKGYTIPYLVDSEKNVIVMLEIFKWINR